MEDWLNKPIPRGKQQRPLFKGTGDQAAAIRKVRFDYALGLIYEPSPRVRYKHSPGRPRNGDLLSYKIGIRLYALQQRLIEAEGRVSAALQQEARDAYRASATPAENSPETSAYFERIWGPLKNPDVTAVPWQPIENETVNLGELFPEPT
ncbi:hypothetical protein MITS9509_01530 [Synechococcus sp. MIT S9509]|uniref:hypothetical protein n=1 Tax=unclassified Synechococcus TaxID=2626047 RepID=UPI0007BC529E|nr:MULTISPECIES: hypothetical protein [unclassified Synechococcus]KZR86522.1 hypothetical protein MITS9504_01122 [Synechococcus sp. MIT S9504]KZR92538.1 hypothetical protein MITS9509_01530 [Synechococcus sp. MIT S9509]